MTDSPNQNDIEILEDFLNESKTLIEKMMVILEKCEGAPEQAEGLAEYGQIVDRIMGAAKSFGLQITKPGHLIHKISDYSAICKVVGYKASQIKNNPQFYDVAVALLLDGTEVLQQMIQGLLTGKNDISGLFTQTFLDRLKWVSSQFGADYRSSVDINKGQKEKLNQGDIDDLIKKLGLD